MSPWLRDRNPLRCAGTPLPANVLLAAKLIVLSAFALGYVGKVPEPFLPLVPIFDSIERPELFRRALQGMMIVGGVGLLLNLRVRLCAFAVGLVFLIGPLSARASYTNGKFFCASMLILIGLWSGPHFRQLLRAQFVVMYLGASLNKLLDPDWRSGQYMEFWLGQLRDSSLYLALAGALPEMAFAKLLAWGTIVGEACIAIGLAHPRTTRAALWGLVGLHVASILLARHTFAIFLYALLAACLVLVPWPKEREAVVSASAASPVARTMRALSRRLDFDRVFVWREMHSNGALRLSWRDRSYTGAAAFDLWLLFQPTLYFLIWALLMAPFARPAERAVAILTVAALWVFPALGLGRGTARTSARR